jgi:hypothetical protein
LNGHKHQIRPGLTQQAFHVTCSLRNANRLTSQDRRL